MLMSRWTKVNVFTDSLGVVMSMKSLGGDSLGGGDVNEFTDSQLVLLVWQVELGHALFKQYTPKGGPTKAPENRWKGERTSGVKPPWLLVVCFYWLHSSRKNRLHLAFW